jgi:hypothetical protein
MSPKINPIQHHYSAATGRETLGSDWKIMKTKVRGDFGSLSPSCGRKVVKPQFGYRDMVHYLGMLLKKLNSSVDFRAGGIRRRAEAFEPSGASCQPIQALEPGILVDGPHEPCARNPGASAVLLAPQQESKATASAPQLCHGSIFLLGDSEGKSPFIWWQTPRPSPRS